ncbi:MAG: hypothetical protein H6728_08685 [Myxococcales bacterium]|nr:hypothetical protein [Myxococcales bacterium]
MRKHTWKSLLPWMLTALFTLTLTRLTTGCTPGVTNEGAVEAKAEVQTEPKTEPQTEPKTETTAEEPAAELAPEEVATPEEPAAPEEKVSEPIAESLDGSTELSPEKTGETTPEPTNEPTGAAPTVKITEPAANAVVTGKVVVKVDATVAAPTTIDSVSLYIDDKKIDEKTRAPYEFELSSEVYNDGDRKIKAVATTTGLREGSDEITLKFSNNGPKITFVKPVASASVNAAFDIEVTVTDIAGVKAGTVKLNVDGTVVAWTSTTGGTYKATFDPSSKPFDSLPMEVSAENVNGKMSSSILWVSHDPAAGPKLLGEECDNSSPQKRCVADHACLTISFINPKSVCYKNCVVGGPLTVCPIVPGKSTQCEPSQTGTTRGACLNADRPPGTLFSKCGGAVTCNSGFVCTGAGTGDSFCLQTCPSTDYNKPCATQGYTCLRTTSTGSCSTDSQCASGLKCVNGTCETGVCVEKCQHACTTDTDCVAGQTCTSGKCSAPYCISYGTCRSIGGVGTICI